jgi:hypothetical protein
MEIWFISPQTGRYSAKEYSQKNHMIDTFLFLRILNPIEVKNF